MAVGGAWCRSIGHDAKGMAASERRADGVAFAPSGYPRSRPHVGVSMSGHIHALAAAATCFPVLCGRAPGMLGRPRPGDGGVSGDGQIILSLPVSYSKTPYGIPRRSSSVVSLSLRGTSVLCPSFFLTLTTPSSSLAPARRMAVLLQLVYISVWARAYEPQYTLALGLRSLPSYGRRLGVTSPLDHESTQSYWRAVSIAGQGAKRSSPVSKTMPRWLIPTAASR